MTSIRINKLNKYVWTIEWIILQSFKFSEKKIFTKKMLYNTETYITNGLYIIRKKCHIEISTDSFLLNRITDWRRMFNLALFKYAYNTTASRYHFLLFLRRRFTFNMNQLLVSKTKEEDDDGKKITFFDVVINFSNFKIKWRLA